MRALAGLWPHGEGEIRLQEATASPTLFLPQKSYVPTGPLIDAISYPAPAGRFEEAACCEALCRVGLDRLTCALHENAPWQQRLSPGEQQRLALVRVLLHRPRILLMDEATSALDCESEHAFHEILEGATEIALIVSISHSPAAERFHTSFLDLKE